jgi:transposase
LIFQSRKYGIFQYTPPDVITPLPPSELEHFGVPYSTPAKRKIKNKPLIGEESSEIYEPVNCLSFGGVYVASKILEESPLPELFASPFANVKGLGESLMPLVLYKLTHDAASMAIKDWLQESYAQFLYPNVNLDSPRIRELLKEIGKEKYWRIFFDKYFQFLQKESSLDCALIDSSGLPDATQSALSQICNHAGKVNREIRLIVVLDKNSGYPIYFKYVPGDIADQITLQHIFDEMDAYDIDVTSAIMDAGYSNEADLRYLYDRDVAFVTRFIPNGKIYKKIIENDIDDIDDAIHHVWKDERRIKAKRVEVNDMAGMKLYAYICKDLVEAHRGQVHLFNNFTGGEAELREMEEIRAILRKRGIIVLLSSIKLPPNKILPFYYDRQDIDQIFDFAINDVDRVPLRERSEATLRGHFLIVFMATISHVYIKKVMENFKILKLSRSDAFKILSRHVTVVYENKNFHLPAIPSAMVRKVYDAFNIEVPRRMIIRR